MDKALEGEWIAGYCFEVSILIMPQAAGNKPVEIQFSVAVPIA
jgi:hypothetical protein